MLDSKQIDNMILKTAQGDKKAFEALYRQTGKQVFAYALSIVKSYHLAEDITQDVFVKIKCSAGYYKPCGKPMAWILKITKNTALMSIRGGKKETLIDYMGNEHFLGAKEDGTEDILMLYSALENLSEEEREIVILKAVSGLKHREIAQLVNRPIGTVLWMYSRAIKKLEKFLAE